MAETKPEPTAPIKEPPKQESKQETQKADSPPKQEKQAEVVTSDDLKRDDLLSDKKAASKGGDELDPNKDYCGSCYSKGVQTELQKGAKNCPKCSSVLDW